MYRSSTPPQARPIRRFGLSLFAIALLTVIIASTPLTATTYVFGEDGGNQDLTGNSLLGSTWPSGNTYIIAGDCYVPYTATLTLQAGVVVSFDYDYDGDADPLNHYPTITVYGTLDCQGIDQSEVWFTNYSGTNSGEFEGIRLDGSYGTDLGRLYADYTIFEYGGYSGGLITMGTDSYAEFYGCWIRFSDNYGINSEDEFEELNLEKCCVDSNASYGVYIEHNAYMVDFQTCTFLDNTAYVQVFPNLIIDNSLFSAEGGNGLIWEIPEIPPEWPIAGPPRIIRSHFYSNGANGLFVDVNDRECYGDIRNCSFASNGGNGILIEGHDLWIQEGAIRILNCTSWGNVGSGISWIGYSVEGENDYFIVQNCVSGANDWYGLAVQDLDSWGDPPFEIGENINAYKANVHGTFSPHVNEPGDFISDENDPPDHFMLALENDGFNLFDHHIYWDSPTPDERQLINEGEEDESCGLDIDGSQTDLGIFGGAAVADFEYPDNWFGGSLDFYSVVEAGVELDEVVLRRNIYRVLSGHWVTTQNHPFTIEAGTELYLNDGVYFWINNSLIVDGTSNNHVLMHPLVDSWDGLIIWGDCYLSYLDIEWTNYGIYIENLLQNPQPAILEYVTVQHSLSAQGFPGIQLFASEATLKGCESTNNIGDGLWIIGGGDEVRIEGGKYSLNGNHGIYCGGANTTPILGMNEDFNPGQSGYYIWIEDNDSTGIKSLNAHPDIAGNSETGWQGLASIVDNHVSQIFIQNYNSLPILYSGYNDIYDPEEVDWAIDYNNYLDGEEQVVVFDARMNYWGTSDPDPEEIFEGWDDQIDYDGLEESEIYLDDMDDFMTALFYYRNKCADTITFAIPLFKRVAENRDYHRHTRQSSLSCLRGSYNRADLSLNILRNYYLDFSEETDDRFLCRVALSEAIWCLYDSGDLESAINEAISLQSDERFNRQDSIFFAIDELCLRNMQRRVFPINDNYNEFYHQLNELSSLVGNSSFRDEILPPIPIDLSLTTYPNPFNGKMNINFQLIEPSIVNIRISNSNGRIIERFPDSYLFMGQHSIAWDPVKLPSGEYIIQVQCEKGQSATRKVILAR